MKQSFSVLHISDLHERGRRESEPARRERVLGDAWLRNLAEIRDEGVDLVCMTGDLAQSGKPDEYERAGDFLARTLAELGLGRDRLFLVPGNHDVDRSRSRKAWLALRGNIHRADQLEVARWIAGGKTPLGMETAWLNGTFKRQEAFRAWLKSFGLPSQLPPESPHGKLGYRSKVRLPNLAFDVWVIGLDSAWLSGSDDDAGNLRLTDAQLDKLCTNERGKPLAGFRVALMHHPLSDLYDWATCRRLLGDTTDLLLHGHVHEVEPALWADPDRRLAQFAAGCLFEGTRADHHPNGCTLIRATCDASGRPQRYELRFRSFSHRSGHWHDDSSLYRAAKNGRLTIEVPDPSGSPQNSRPSLPESPSTPTAEDGQQRAGAVAQGAPGPTIAELELEQRYRDSVLDTYSRASSLGILRWQHSGKPPQNLSRLKLFVPHAFRRLIQPGTGFPSRTTSSDAQRGESAPQDSNVVTHDLALSRHRCCLLLGAPGAGKSEITSWLALLLGAADTYPDWLPPALLPIRIELSALDEDDRNAGDALGGIIGYTHRSLTAHGMSSLAIRLPMLVETGRILFLFDGMDGVRSSARRERLAGMIRTLYRTTPCRVIVTSRLALDEELTGLLSPASSAGTDTLEIFAAYYLEPFDAPRISQYLDKWHQEALSGDEAKRSARLERLRRSQEESHTLRDLAANPLLLTLLCALNQHHELPRRRHRIFAEAARLMIRDWGAQREGLRRDSSDSLGNEDKQRFLEELAWGMHQGRWQRGGANKIHRAELFQFAVEFQRLRRAEEATEVIQDRTEALLRKLEQEDHLLSHLGADLFAFIHGSFLEYLAAQHAVRTLTGTQLAELFSEHGFDEAWLEVFTLSCGLLDDEGKAGDIKLCLQELLRQVPLRFSDRDKRMAYAAVAIRCLAEVQDPSAEPLRTLASLVMQLLQKDAVAIMRRGMGAWRDQEVVTALRHYGPRWPSHAELIAWALQPIWQKQDLGFDLWCPWAFRCVLAATPPAERTATLLRLLSTEGNLFVIADSLSEAARLGPWKETEVVELAQIENDELRIRMGLELASSGAPELLVAVLNRPLHDWICLYIARDNSKTQNQELWTAAWRTLYRLTGSANSTIRARAVHWLAPARTELAVRQRFLDLVRTDPEESVRFQAAVSLIGTEDQPTGIATLLELLGSKDPRLLEDISVVLERVPEQRERRFSLLLHLLGSEDDVARNRAAAALATSFLDRKEVEDRLVLHIERHPESVRNTYGMPAGILANARILDAMLRALYTAPHFLEFNSGLLTLTGTLRDQPAVKFLMEKLKTELVKPLDDRARLYISMWLHQHGLARSDARPHLRRLAEDAQAERIRVQAAGLLDSEGSAHIYSLVVHTDNPEVRSEAIWALVYRCSDPVVQLWLQDLAKTSQSAMVRIRSALALCSVSDVALREAGQAALVAIVNDDRADESVRLEAAEELVQRPVLEQLAEHATSEEIRLRAQDSIAVLDLRDQILSLPISVSQTASGLDTSLPGR
jgi:calcineurin-like phosphoesterase family protein